MRGFADRVSPSLDPGKLVRGLAWSRQWSGGRTGELGRCSKGVQPQLPAMQSKPLKHTPCRRRHPVSEALPPLHLGSCSPSPSLYSLCPTVGSEARAAGLEPRAATRPGPGSALARPTSYRIVQRFQNAFSLPDSAKYLSHLY